MKIHLTHKFTATEHLELCEYASDRFDVTYLTQEGVDKEGREMWFCNNSDVYKSFSDAKAGFNKRMASSKPFNCLQGKL